MLGRIQSIWRYRLCLHRSSTLRIEEIPKLGFFHFFHSAIATVLTAVPRELFYSCWVKQFECQSKIEFIKRSLKGPVGPMGHKKTDRRWSKVRRPLEKSNSVKKPESKIPECPPMSPKSFVSKKHFFATWLSFQLVRDRSLDFRVVKKKFDTFSWIFWRIIERTWSWVFFVIYWLLYLT